VFIEDVNSDGFEVEGDNDVDPGELVNESDPGELVNESDPGEFANGV